MNFQSALPARQLSKKARQQSAPVNDQKSSLLGINFNNVSLKKALELVKKTLSDQVQSNLFFVNAHCLNVAYNDGQYRDALKKASLVFPDGSGVNLGCKILSKHLQHNLNGTDLFPHLCQLFANQKQNVFLLGAKPGTAEKVAKWMTSHYPQISIVGCHHGHFDKNASSELCEAINQSKANVLFVAMGVPMQEMWINDNAEKLNTQLNIAVGGLFEFYSNSIPRAPQCLRAMGMEWCWRLLQEPKRMFNRYILGNPLFVSRIFDEKRLNHFLVQQPKKLDLFLYNLWQSVRAKKIRSVWHLKHWWQDKSKRLMDITLSLFALLALSPMFAVVVIAIKIESRGPIFFKQQRAGLRGRPFLLWKLRSMYQDAEARKKDLEHLNEKKGGVMFKIKNDPRITRVGKILRRFSIDELPQIWNVLKGDMSIVGPRPALYNEVAQYNLRQRGRLDIKPGLTSEWVVAGRNNLSFEEQASLDVDYYYRHSIYKDLKLILQTIPVVFSGRGAS